MAFNPSLKVSAAREIAKQFGKHQVIVLMLDRESGTLEYASYGETRPLCDEAKVLADAAYDAVINKMAE